MQNVSASAVTPTIIKAWQIRASDLSIWAWHLVNRVDVWGGYQSLADRDKVVKRHDGSAGPLGPTTTRPCITNRGKVFLTLVLLERHFRSMCPECVVGVHTTSPENTCRWGAIEVDHHGVTSTPADVNFHAVVAWYERLRSLGFHPLLTDSNGRGGFHLLTVFSQPTPSTQVFDFLRWLSNDFAALGLPTQPETFPKQRALAPGRYGNWLRLPGRHHTRDHWSKVWDVDRWLEGDDAVQFILSLHGDSPFCIPNEAIRAVAPPTLSPSPVRSVSAAAGPGLARRIRAYIRKLPTGLGEGQHRDDYAFGFACFLARDLAMSDSDALVWLQEWDRLQAVQKGQQRLQEILSNAKKYGQRPMGCGLRHEHVAGKVFFIDVEV